MRLVCRNCECSQEAAPNCRRCGRPMPGYRAPEPAPALVPDPPPSPERVILVTVESKTFAEIERVIILTRIAQCNGNIVRAALSLGIGKTTLYRKLREYEANSRNDTQISESQSNI